jgi:hypothetical protein
MADSTTKLPSKKIVFSLFKKMEAAKSETSEIVQDLNSEITGHVENSSVHKGALKYAGAIRTKLRKNEIAGMEFIDHLRVYLDWVEEENRGESHVGDIVKMAQVDKPEEPPKKTRARSKKAEELVEAPANVHVLQRGKGKGKGITKKDKQAIEDFQDELAPPKAEPKLDDGFDDLGSDSSYKLQG